MPADKAACGSDHREGNISPMASLPMLAAAVSTTLNFDFIIVPVMRVCVFCFIVDMGGNRRLLCDHH